MAKSTALAKRAASLQKAPRGKQPDYELRADWIVADVSYSMAAHIPRSTTVRRIDCLNQAINSQGDDVQVIAFSDTVEYPPIAGKVAFEPRDSTNMAPALEIVAKYEPRYVIIISDGEVNAPDCDHATARERCYKIAAELAKSAVIETLYIGPQDETAVAFMKKLAEIGHGRYKSYDLSVVGSLVAIDEQVQHLLPAPEQEIKL